MSGQQLFAGRSIVGGCTLGRPLTLGRAAQPVEHRALASSELEAEVARLRRAVTSAGEELERTARVAAADSADRSPAASDLEGIFRAQALLLEDQELQASIERHIFDHQANAEWAVSETLGALIERFDSLAPAAWQERADDIRDLGRRLLRNLSGAPEGTVEDLRSQGPVILLAHDLTPSEAIRWARAGVSGFALEVGGQTSHTAIIARALDLPMVAGIAGAGSLAAASQALIDGDRGQLILEPDAETLAGYRQRRQQCSLEQAELDACAQQPAVTLDGVRVRLMANIDLPDELADAARHGAEGIGLYRSEFLFIERSPELPSEEEQLSVLRDLLAAAAPHPAVVRTFDLGGRKLAREVIETHEDNPVLGLRGIRLTLHRRDIFKSQIRAILRAGVDGRLRVLLPMVTASEEITEFRQLVAECATELEEEGVSFRSDFKLGVMIEVPSAALIADRLARQVDFLSLGTNDLIQYALAIDRNNEHVAYLYQPLHPAILRMVRFVVEAAANAGIGVMLCGEVAADPRATAILLGLGLRHLSVTPRAIPVIKQQIRRLRTDTLTKIADQCLEVDSAQEVEALLRSADSGS